MALCPNHLDRVASLRVEETPDGIVLLRCHAGCRTQDVVAAINLTMADLFPHGPGFDGPTSRFGPADGRGRC